MTDIQTAFVTFLETRTLDSAQRLEVALDDAYPDDPLVQELVEVLALYRPGGGELLFDEQQIDPHLERLRAHLGIRSA